MSFSVRGDNLFRKQLSFNTRIEKDWYTYFLEDGVVREIKFWSIKVVHFVNYLLLTKNTRSCCWIKPWSFKDIFYKASPYRQLASFLQFEFKKKLNESGIILHPPINKSNGCKIIFFHREICPQLKLRRTFIQSIKRLSLLLFCKMIYWRRLSK